MAVRPLLSYAVLNPGWARLGRGDPEGARAAFRRAFSEATRADEQAKARALAVVAKVAVQGGLTEAFDERTHLSADEILTLACAPAGPRRRGRKSAGH